MTSPRIFTTYQLAVGAGDLLTGILLVFAPELALAWMGLRLPAHGGEFMSFIGTFVFAVGLSYFFFARPPASAADAAAVRAAWLVTGIIRVSVAIFVFTACAFNRLEFAWTLVGSYDLTLGTIQLILAFRPPPFPTNL